MSPVLVRAGRREYHPLAQHSAPRARSEREGRESSSPIIHNPRARDDASARRTRNIRPRAAPHGIARAGRPHAASLACDEPPSTAASATQPRRRDTAYTMGRLGAGARREAPANVHEEADACTALPYTARVMPPALRPRSFTRRPQAVHSFFNLARYTECQQTESSPLSSLHCFIKQSRCAQHAPHHPLLVGPAKLPSLPGQSFYGETRQDPGTIGQKSGPEPPDFAKCAQARADSVPACNRERNRFPSPLSRGCHASRLPTAADAPSICPTRRAPAHPSVG